MPKPASICERTKAIKKSTGNKKKEKHETKTTKTQPFIFSGDEGADVGLDGETAVSNDYKQGDNEFTGKIAKVTIDVSPSKLSDADEKKVEEAGETATFIED